MKHLSVTLLLSLALSLNGMAQTVIVTTVSNNDSILMSDTTTIKVGNLSVQVGQNLEDTYHVEGDSTGISVQAPDTWIKIGRSHTKRFNGHWASFQMGVNGFAGADYSMYAPTEGIPTDFMDLRQAASWEVNFNVLEWNIALNKQKNFGLVSGLGFSWNNYKFDNEISLDKDANGFIYPYAVEDNNFKKSKLMLCYLTVPLMVEYQFPINDGRDRMFVSAGVVGGLNIKSLTKVKTDDSKSKDRGSLSVNPFKGSGIFQVGGNNVSFYATYSFSQLFEDKKGPELYPFSVGISLLNLW